MSSKFIPRIHVLAYIDPSQEYHHLCTPLAGLCALEEEGYLSLEFAPFSDLNLALPARSVHLVLDVSRSLGTVTEKQKWVIDLKDSNQEIDLGFLRISDVYLKRSFQVNSIQAFSELHALSPAEQSKIFPMGLSFPCQAPGATSAYAFEILNQFLHGKIRKNLVQDIKRLIIYSRITPRSYFLSPQIPFRERTPVILYQPRLWTPLDFPGGDVEKINSQRAETVRLLKKHFGPRFQGGLIPNQRAMQDYPDLVTSEKGTHRDDYLRLMRRSWIGISTQGLYGSIPWKVAEYLSSGLALVTDRLQNTLPEPLIEGNHLFTYQSAEQCLDICDSLFQNPKQIEEISNQNTHWFQAFADPAALFRGHFDRFKTIS